MSQPESFDALQRRRDLVRRRRMKIEQEEKLIERQLKGLERSRSTQTSSSRHQGAMSLGIRRLSTGTKTIHNAERSLASTSMNRSFTVQPSTSPMDGFQMSSMPMIQEFGVATGMMDRLSQDEPANAFLLNAGRPSEMGVSECPTPDIGTNPLEFLASLPVEDEFIAADFFHYPPLESREPSLVSGGESAATPMSRESSAVSGSYLVAPELTSSESNLLLPPMEQWPVQPLYSITNPQQSQNDAKNLCTDDMFAGMGANFPAAAESVIMSRSISTSSTSSMRSTGSKQGERAKEAHERHIKNGLRNNIAPRPSDDAEKTDASSNTASKKDGKVAVAKTPYQRRVKERVFCGKCNLHPGGFRGQHELSRHEAAKHANIVTRYQVRDPRKVGIRTSLNPITELDNCKACKGNKQYGAYYNVAAHLRRFHFRNKQRKQSKKHHPQVNNPGKFRMDELPSMTELKKWMVEVKVRGGEAQPLAEDADQVLDPNSSLRLSVPDLALSPETNSSTSSDSPYEMALEIPLGLMAGDSNYVDYGEPFMSSRSLDYSDLADRFTMAPLGVAQ